MAAKTVVKSFFSKRNMKATAITATVAVVAIGAASAFGLMDKVVGAFLTAQDFTAAKLSSFTNREDPDA